jgi:hypothetical protein
MWCTPSTDWRDYTAASDEALEHAAPEQNWRGQLVAIGPISVTGLLRQRDRDPAHGPRDGMARSPRASWRGECKHRVGMTDETALFNRIQEGMHVMDASGEDIGRVDLIRMGDPQATTATAGNEDRGSTPLDFVAEAFGAESEPDVPEPLRSRLVREGYLKLDSANLLEADRYVPANYVRGVTNERVELNVRKQELAREG